MKNLTPEQIEEEGYLLLYELDHKQLIPFIQGIYRKHTPYSRSYIALNIIIILAAVGVLVYFMITKDIFAKPLAYLFGGILLTFPLIPVHEYIHGLAYKSLGAKHVGYTANFKKLYFTAQANRFVVNYREFIFLAFAPFVVITLACLIAIPFLESSLILIPLGILAMHTGACGGDFALVSYLYPYRKQGVITYDDFPNKRTFFFIKPSLKNESTP